MTANQRAQANRTRILGEPLGPLTATDPDFSTAFENFAFDEVLRETFMDDTLRLQIMLAASLGTGSVSFFEQLVPAALRAQIDAGQVREIVYQAVPYLGFAKAYPFIVRLNELLTDAGIPLPLPDASTTTPQDRRRAGIAVQMQLFGEDHIKSMYADSTADLIHIQQFLSGNCFGDYYTRTGLDLQTRELLTFVFLISMGGADAQARGHVVGNLHIGNDRLRLIDTVTQLVPYIGYPRALNALSAINAVAPVAEIPDDF